MHISEAYSRGVLRGWYPDIAQEEFRFLSSNFYTINPGNYKFIRDTGKMMLYQFTRKVLGTDTENYPQLGGSCVSFGMKNAVEYVQCSQISLGGKFEKFRKIFCPYLYGTGRVFVGRGRLNGTDGSMGSWMADAVIKYGALASDEPNCPKYDRNVERKWGDSPGPPKSFVDIASNNLVKSAAIIRDWDQLCVAIANGYPCTVASSQGFQMEAGSSGFHEASGRWDHQMCIIGFDNEHPEPYGIVLNSWGPDCHGILKDFKTGERLPPGVLRVRRRVLEDRMIKAGGETFAISQFEGFPDNSEKIDRAMFDFVRNFW